MVDAHAFTAPFSPSLDHTAGNRVYDAVSIMWPSCLKPPLMTSLDSTAFFTGFPFMSTLILLPQQLQLEYGLSPVRAGIHMLALLLLSATGATMGGVLSSNWGISWYLLAGSQALQMIGLGLLSMSPARNGSVPSLLPAYQVILGLGFGLSLSSLTSVVRAEVEQRDDGKLSYPVRLVSASIAPARCHEHD